MIRMEGGPAVALQKAKRFFYFDGLAVGKFEVVLLTAPRKLDHPIHAQRFTETFLSGKALVRSQPGHLEEHSVAGAGPALARLYLRASTAKSFQGNIGSRWVQAAMPCLILYYSRKEQVQIPSRARKLPCRSDKRVTVHQWWQQVGNSGVRVFAIRRSRSAPSVGASRHAGTCRELRILLGRLHTEHECLWKILGEVDGGGSTEEGIRRDSEFFQYYLNEATRRLLRAEAASESYFEGRSDAIMTAPQWFEEMVPNGGDRLLQKLRMLNVRPQIFAKTAKMIKEVRVGDTYNFFAPVGAAGPRAKAEGNTFNQQQFHVAQLFDVAQLAVELAELREALIAPSDDPSRCADIEAVAQAEIAAKTGDGNAAFRHLQSVGRWVLETARGLSVEIVVKALEGRFGASS